MRRIARFRIIDALYGEVEFSKELSALIWLTPIQRLRHVRLSNIDSLEMPGISNISRYEHALGVCFLATKVGFSSKLDSEKTIVLQASALLHDWAITPYGHLVEEAYSYVKMEYDHEKKTKDLRTLVGRQEVGGIGRQFLYGRETKIEPWAVKTFGNNWEKCIDEISSILRGESELGKCISSAIDLDNVDNLTRIAFHMGLNVDRTLPLRIAEGMIDYNSNDGIIFSPETVGSLQNWIELRKTVYSHLMTSRMDFCGKAMLIQATVWALEDGIIDGSDWNLTDDSLIARLTSCKEKKIKQAIERWLTGELWELSELSWMRGVAPEYRQMLEFSRIASQEIGRECFAYRIKDKRTRKVAIMTSDGLSLQFGTAPTEWLFGVVFPKSNSCTSEVNKKLIDLACEIFKATHVKCPAEHLVGDKGQTMLLPFRECD